MKEKLLFTNEHFQEPDIALTEVEIPQATPSSSSSGSPSTDNEAFDPSASSATARASTTDASHADVVAVSVSVDNGSVNLDRTVNAETVRANNFTSAEDDDRQRMNSATEMQQQ